jgi:diguanylate cyclase
MPSVYNHWLVGLSLVVAMLVSYTALRLASRVATSEGKGSRIWLGIGAIAMGIGIWSMHFVGMLALELPISLAYDVATTLASLAVAIVISGFALAITSGGRLTVPRLAGSAVIMGSGIAAMHYMGMAAITILPGIIYDPFLVAVSILIAIAASFVALWLFFQLREGNSAVQQLKRIAAAVVMGLAISGMHYTGMAASRFASGSFCRGGITLHDNWLAAVIGVFALGLLVVTLVTAVYDAHLQSRTRIQAQRLEQANAELQHQATHDALTGLPNRLLFIDRLGREIAHAERDGHFFAVLAVDLDRFKVINDTLGHGPGDQLLIEIARRLTNSVRSADTVARTGGDEFLLLLTEIREAADAAVIANKIILELDKSVSISGAEVHTSASIGISVYPADGSDSNTLVARADEAMYFAKQAGRNSFQFFSPGMSVFSRERLDLESELRRALPLKQFEVHYQPKVDVVTGRMNSVEALLRWRHPTRGDVPPAVFIPVAEQGDLIHDIGRFVLGEAVRQAAEWYELAPGRSPTVAINISGRQLQRPGFVEEVREVLAASGLPPQLITLELTESTLMNDTDGSMQALALLKSAGVRLAIDDFGTGYSSLSYLRRFPMDVLKIDRSFTKDATEDGALLEAIVAMGESLGLVLIPEGIEEPEQADALRALGCRLGQGYLFGRPVPADELTGALITTR